MNKGRLEAFSDGVLAAMWLLPDPRIEKRVAPLESKALIDPRR